ncbi:uncharacterized protein LOC119370840 [Jatropha curcas]|uniref:uncharacterized protein LOC119370840 n=1 Tax=Jatropha curcas TaxID=180498 RepID=UPI001895B0B1|nr:uncharacterized protein LOC119370840 [Jatropha curcas]
MEEDCSESFRTKCKQLSGLSPPVFTATKARKRRKAFAIQEDAGIRLKYNKIEKLCLALVWACTKLQHYFSSYTTYVISESNPLKFLMERPVLNCKMAKWVSVLAAYDLKFVQRKVVKGGALADQLVADQLAELPVEDQMQEVEFPDEDLLSLESEVWEMYFNGASNYHGNGVGVVFKTPCGEYIPIAVKLDFDCTNNEAEYEACIKGLEAALEKEIKVLRVYSNLIVSQALRKWKIKEERLVPYLQRLDERNWLSNFGILSFTTCREPKISLLML